ncbi:hypothetical protein Pelo_9232 [Pelomyxa schiedti]|nr:hypothetical protein Pelo_9232 [Pelomyxa schiedti]
MLVVTAIILLNVNIPHDSSDDSCMKEGVTVLLEVISDRANHRRIIFEMPQQSAFRLQWNLAHVFQTNFLIYYYSECMLFGHHPRIPGPLIDQCLSRLEFQHTPQPAVSLCLWVSMLLKEVSPPT